MDKMDVLRIVRANDEKFKMHLNKLRRLEEKENRINAKFTKEGKAKEGLRVNNEEDKNSNYVYNQLFNSIEDDYHERQEISQQNNDIVQFKSDDNKLIGNDDKRNKEMNQAENETKFPPEDNHLNMPNKQQRIEFDDKKQAIKMTNDNNKHYKKENDNNNDAYIDNSYSNAKQCHQIEKNNKDNKLLLNPNKNKIEAIATVSSNIQCTKNDDISKVKEHYIESDTSNRHSDNDNDSINNKEGNYNYHNEYENQLNADISEREYNTNNSKKMPIKPTHFKNHKIKSPIKSNLPEKINAAVNDNESKRPYTAYTYSTIQKIKNNTKAPQSKII